MTLAPIILFTYKRLDTLQLTVDALKKNYLAKDSDLIIFSDAAKTSKDQVAVNNVRTYLKTISGFKSITINEANTNKGLANSIIDGVSLVLQQHESVIVLEDDLVSSPNFLNYMNEALSFYKYENAVFSISGYSFNLELSDKIKEDSYFINRGWSWGWATWRNRWEQIDWEINDYSNFIQNKNERREFSKGGSDLNAMLDKQMTGNLDSWAIRWFYNQYKVKGLTLYPVQSKIFNAGFGKEATHTVGSSKRYIPVLDKGDKISQTFPNKIEINNLAQKKFQKKMGYLSRLKSKIETLLKL